MAAMAGLHLKHLSVQFVDLVALRAPGKAFCRTSGVVLLAGA
jgi:hypothetical protein